MDLLSEIDRFYYHMALYELRVLNQKDYYKGFSYNSILYLNVISQMESCTTGKLAQALQISAPAATSKVNELIKQGAVRKTQSEDDKRVFYIKIHPDMEKNFSIYNHVFRNIEHELRKSFSEEQLLSFSEILRAISQYDWKDIGNEQGT